jgi:hypothetical protein
LLGNQERRVRDNVHYEDMRDLKWCGGFRFSHIQPTTIVAYLKIEMCQAFGRLREAQ